MRSGKHASRAESPSIAICWTVTFLPCAVSHATPPRIPCGRTADLYGGVLGDFVDNNIEGYGKNQSNFLLFLL